MKPTSTFYQKHKLAILLSVFSVLFVIGIWLIMFSIVPDLPSDTIEKFGVLGDSFNIITSLFTGLAFAGVIVSVVLQTQELKLQRQELKENTEELKGQKEQLEKQQQEMVSQSFDNKFFQMLNMFNTNIAGLEYDNEHKGKKAIKILKDILLEDVDLRGMMLEIKHGNNPIPKSKQLETFNNKFNQFNQNNGNILKPYFINLYQILKYIDEKAPKKEAKRYSNILRAQLSIDELILLLCNAIGIIQFSGEKYKKLLEKYAFFEHLSVEDLSTEKIFFIDNVLKEYSSKVAGKNVELAKKIKQKN